MKEKKIQWHPGFAAALDLEFRSDREYLHFEKEYNLNTKPLAVDLLVIKKNAAVRLDNEIGRIFRGHNLLEYKSPGDHLNIDTFYKTIAYACLYKSYEKTLNAVRADDVTVSLVREGKPEELFGYLEENGFRITHPYRGIYYIEGPVMFLSQVVVTGELELEEHVWLRALSEKLKEKEMRVLLERTSCLTGKYDQELADSVLNVSALANERVVEKLMEGDGSMSEALLEIMKPMIEPMIEKQRQIAMEEGRSQGLRQGISQGFSRGIDQGLKQGLSQGQIQGAVRMLRHLGYDDAVIRQELWSEYGLSGKAADEYL